MAWIVNDKYREHPRKENAMNKCTKMDIDLGRANMLPSGAWWNFVPVTETQHKDTISTAK